jgi:hypothetical protein
MTVLDQVYRDRLSVWSDIQGHLEFMHDLVVSEDAKVVVELGVRDGVSTSALLAAVEKTGGLLWSVDTESIPPQPWDFEDDVPWRCIRGDDLTLAYSPHMPGRIDICFIDTVHWFHHTLAELRLYAPKSEIVLLHDTELEHPWQVPPEDPPFPVREAVKHYVSVDVEAPPLAPTKKGPIRQGDPEPRWQVEWRPGSYGMAVMRRR